MAWRRAGFGLGLAACVAASAAIPDASAQGPPQSAAQRGYATRPALEQLHEWYERLAESTAYSEPLREVARERAERLRSRLEGGDFQVGDRIRLVVEGEATLSDSFTVAEGPELVLPIVGSVPLRGVLRAELQDFLTAQLSRYIREPRVRSSTVIRVAILGGVRAPGFYMVPSHEVLSQTLMFAGGPAPRALIDEMQIMRGDEPILEGARMREALVQGRTIDQLNLQAGDRIVVPQGGGIGGLEGPLRTVGYLLALPAAVLGIVSIF